MTIHPRSKWLCVGKDEGFDLVHTVVEVDLSNPKTPRIMAYSDVYQEDSYDGEPDEREGRVWWGTVNRFLRDFAPLGEEGESAA